MDDSSGKALKYALRILGYRDRSMSEMRQKLAAKGFSMDVVDATLVRLEEKGFIDDRRFAELLKRDAVERRNYGVQGTRRYLLKRGISPEITDAVTDGDEDYEGAARRLVEKKMKLMNDCSEDTARRRLWGLLSRRGFSADTIYRVLKSIATREDGNEG
ncbi:MAG: regulatory protein RecX [Nitrospirae bacterium]|nr:regulatory protein RecX [Nitrospirota bacterium]